MTDKEHNEAEISREIFIQRAEDKYGPADKVLLESAASWIPDGLARQGLIDDEIGDYLVMSIVAGVLSLGAGLAAETLQ